MGCGQISDTRDTRGTTSRSEERDKIGTKSGQNAAKLGCDSDRSGGDGKCRILGVLWIRISFIHSGFVFMIALRVVGP